MELTDRKKQILKEVVDAYILTGEPVGSKAIEKSLGCSSATIRNEMGDLEKAGLLQQPHTSAGRIPTGRGYRLYVDSLMENYRLSFEESLLLHSLLSRQAESGAEFWGEMARLLSSLTEYAVVGVWRVPTGTIERFEGVFVNPASFLLVMITSSGRALTKQLHLDFPLDADRLAVLIDLLNSHLAKKELGGVTMERIAAMEKDLGEMGVLIAPLLGVIYDMTATLGRENVTVHGVHHLFSFPEFADPETASAILAELEDHPALVERCSALLSEGLRVRIATDGPGLDKASFVLCPFRLGQGVEGTLCILGPKRMNYAKAVAKLEFLAKKLNAAHGFEPRFPLIETKG